MMNPLNLVTHSLFKQIAQYVTQYEIKSNDTLAYALLRLRDAVGCAAEGMSYPECIKHLGPIVPGTWVPHGARVIGTQLELDPIKATFDNAVLMSWSRHNDCLVSEDGNLFASPSICISSVLSVSDFVSRQHIAGGYPSLSMKELLVSIVKVYEIFGAFLTYVETKDSGSNQNTNNYLAAKIASVAVCTHILGGGEIEIIDALSQVCADGLSIDLVNEEGAYRHLWGSGDSVSRAIRLALITMTGESGYSKINNERHESRCPSDENQPVQINLQDHFIKNAFTKFHGSAVPAITSAIEAASLLNIDIVTNKDAIESVTVEFTTNKDDFLQQANLTASNESFSEELKLIVAALFTGEVSYQQLKSTQFFNASLSNANVKLEPTEPNENLINGLSARVRVEFNNGEEPKTAQVRLPISDVSRFDEQQELLIGKFSQQAQMRYPKKHAEQISHLMENLDNVTNMTVNEFMDFLVI
ncbi:MAG: MmgE/PrpD family protein [Gammaproteobacteria bacterium]|nr:MmgE/PrpD family protein [Gammaproteobacteria bacterium]